MGILMFSNTGLVPVSQAIQAQSANGTWNFCSPWLERWNCSDGLVGIPARAQSLQ
jgi:hypothetical protein